MGWACIGIASDWAYNRTIYKGKQYSISYFISTSSGTGGLCCFAFFPCLFMWLYGPASDEGRLKLTAGRGEYCCGIHWITLLGGTQMTFQICFGLFLFFSLCGWPMCHTTVVLMFVFSEVIHFIVWAAHLGCSSTLGKVMSILSLTALLILVLGALTGLRKFSWLPYDVILYGFWFGECTGFMLVCIITPLLWSLPNPMDELRSQTTEITELIELVKKPTPDAEKPARGACSSIW